MLNKKKKHCVHKCFEHDWDFIAGTTLCFASASEDRLQSTFSGKSHSFLIPFQRRPGEQVILYPWQGGSHMIQVSLRMDYPAVGAHVEGCTALGVDVVSIRGALKHSHEGGRKHQKQQSSCLHLWKAPTYWRWKCTQSRPRTHAHWMQLSTQGFCS